MKIDSMGGRRFWSPSRVTRLLLPGLVLAGAVREARAQVGPDDLCTGNPCTITRDADVDTGGLLQLDFGARRVILDAVLTTGATVVTILAGSFEIRGGGQIRGTAGVTISTEGSIVLNGTRSTGALRLIGPDEAVLALVSRSGAVSGTGKIFLDAGDAESSGGTLNVTSATRIELRGDVTASGGSLAGGGTIDLDTQGDVLLTASIGLSGGEDDGGTLSVTAAGSVRFEGPLVLEGGGDQGFGGEIDVSAGEDVAFLQPLRLRGSTTGPSSCGDAGSLDVVASGTVTIDAEADLRSRVGDCSGGTVDIDAAVVSLGGSILLDARGNDGSGGDLTIAVAGSFDCRSLLNVSGEFGGSVTVEGEGDVVLPPACVVDAGGPGGQVDVRGMGNVTLRGRVTAGSAESVAVQGASFINVRGCRIAVDSGASLRSLGTGSENILSGRSTITVAGTMEAGSANVLILPIGFVPKVTGTVTPRPMVINDPQVVACEDPPPTATSSPSPTPTPSASATATASPTGAASPSPTASPTPTPSPTPTVTPVTPACTGDCDEDEIVSLAEVVTCVNIALGVEPRTRCPSLDADDSGTIEISEPVAAVANLLGNCPGGKAVRPQPPRPTEK